MQLTTSLRVAVRPEAIVDHEDGVRRLADGATKDKKTQNWVAYQTPTTVPAPFVFRTRIRVNSGGQETCEELIRKILLSAGRDG
jgi:hypothetical protein